MRARVTGVRGRRTFQVEVLSNTYSGPDVGCAWRVQNTARRRSVWLERSGGEGTGESMVGGGVSKAGLGK